MYIKIRGGYLSIKLKRIYTFFSLLRIFLNFSGKSSISHFRIKDVITEYSAFIWG